MKSNLNKRDEKTKRKNEQKDIIDNNKKQNQISLDLYKETSGSLNINKEPIQPKEMIKI